MITPWKNIQRFTAKFLKQPQYAVHVACKRLQAFLSHYTGKGKSPFPESMHQSQRKIF